MVGIEIDNDASLDIANNCVMATLNLSHISTTTPECYLFGPYVS